MSENESQSLAQARINALSEVFPLFDGNMETRPYVGFFMEPYLPMGIDSLTIGHRIYLALNTEDRKEALHYQDALKKGMERVGIDKQTIDHMRVIKFNDPKGSHRTCHIIEILDDAIMALTDKLSGPQQSALFKQSVNDALRQTELVHA